MSVKTQKTLVFMQFSAFSASRLGALFVPARPAPVAVLGVLGCQNGGRIRSRSGSERGCGTKLRNGRLPERPKGSPEGFPGPLQAPRSGPRRPQDPPRTPPTWHFLGVPEKDPPNEPFGTHFGAFGVAILEQFRCSFPLFRLLTFVLRSG